MKAEFNQYEDLMLLTKFKVLLDTGCFYKKFTPYYNNASTKKVKDVDDSDLDNYFKEKMELDCEYSKDKLDSLYKSNEKVPIKGGRQQALSILSKMEKFKNYAKDRNEPNKKTTQLSAYLKFGCVSIREVYIACKKIPSKDKEELIRQLYWRDFYLNIAFHYPHVVGNAMKPNYDKIEWKNNAEWIEKWKEGKTGYPIVDAGIRQMNQTGWMPNRLRMVTSNFLVKVLLVDWRIGEKYFANKLVDYDLANNNGGWQWSSGSGADSQPYFRIFNPRL